MMLDMSTAFLSYLQFSQSREGVGYTLYNGSMKILGTALVPFAAFNKAIGNTEYPREHERCNAPRNYFLNTNRW